MRKRKHLIRFLLIGFSSFVILFFALSKEIEANSNFALGADIGWMKQLEDEGVKWLDDFGVQQDPLQILKEHGINAVRLRVFVNPPSNYYWLKDGTTWTMLGYSDKNGVIEAAQRAKALGMDVMVDFHYSDVFADPGHQYKPSAWESHNFNQLQASVYSHTLDVLTELGQYGITPKWVQVGNEINTGILHPSGSTNNFGQLTALLNSGYDAVKDVNPSIKVITHLADGDDNSLFRWWFDQFFQNGGKTDIIGMSFYPYWAGEPYWELVDDLEYNLNDMVSRYDKEVMVVEVGGEDVSPEESYWTIKETINAVDSVPNGKGLGVFYWEPQANSSVLPDQYALGATRVVTNNTLQYTLAIDAFSDASEETGINLLSNPGFEANEFSYQPFGWDTWSSNSQKVNYVEDNGFMGSYKLSHWSEAAYQVSTYQTKYGITNGMYTLQARVKSSDGFNSNKMYIKNYGGYELNIDIPITDQWTQVTIPNIQVTNGQAEIGFWTDGNPNSWINVDNVQFFRES